MAHGKKTGGRQKGTPNKNTAEIKDMIRSALEQAGGQDYLARQAKENPSAFMSLIGKLVPANIKAEVEKKVTLADLIMEIPRYAKDKMQEK